MKHEPITDYDTLFCTTLKEDTNLLNSIILKDIKELLTVFCRQYPNDKELGRFIRQHYGSTEGK